MASLATIGTSPPPTPEPSLSSEATGEFLLSAEAPIASVEIDVAANAALRSEATSHTIVRIARSNLGAEQAQPVLLAIQPLEPAGTGATIAAWPQFQSFFDEGCPPGACTRRYRITAALADPGAVAEPVEVTWTAVAENRTGTPDKPVPLDPDAKLLVTAGDIVAVPAANLVTAALPFDSRRLDATNPRFTQLVTITRPQGAGVIGGSLFATMLRATIVSDDPDNFSNSSEVRVEDLEGNPVSRGNDAGTQQVELPACEDAGGCSTDLRVIGEWGGGRAADNGVTIDWSLAAASFAVDDAVTGPAPGSVVVAAGDLVAAPLQAAGETNGELVVGGEAVVRRNVTVVIDEAALSGDVDGALFVQATLTAATTSRSGTDGPIRVSVAGESVGADDGSDLTTVSRVLPVDCSTRVCHVVFPIGANAYDHPDDDVRVAWKLSVAVLAEPPASFEAGATVTFDVVEAR